VAVTTTVSICLADEASAAASAWAVLASAKPIAAVRAATERRDFRTACDIAQYSC